MVNIIRYVRPRKEFDDAAVMKFSNLFGITIATRIQDTSVGRYFVCASTACWNENFDRDIGACIATNRLLRGHAILVSQREVLQFGGLANVYFQVLGQAVNADVGPTIVDRTSIVDVFNRFLNMQKH